MKALERYHKIGSEMREKPSCKRTGAKKKVSVSTTIMTNQDFPINTLVSLVAVRYAV
jgi:hypothetical protein